MTNRPLTPAALALASLPAPRAFKEACAALRMRLGRSLTEAEFNYVDELLRAIRRGTTTRQVVTGPLPAEVRRQCARAIAEGRPLPELYAREVEAHRPQTAMGQAFALAALHRSV